MKSFKVRITVLIALALAFLGCLGAFIGVYTAQANRYVTLTGTSIFNTSGDAQIWAHRVEQYDESNNVVADPEDPWYYTMFALGEGDTVSYRRNLAYSWFENALDKDDYATEEGEESEEAAPVKAEKREGSLNLKIGFEELNFEKFTIAFETQQYEMTKEEKTVNYLIFMPEKDAGGANTGKVIVFATDDNEEAEKKAAEISVPADRVALNPDNIAIITHDMGEKGEYAVAVYNQNDGEEIGPGTVFQKETFKNVGKPYAKYVSSSTKPVTPIIFSAELPENADGSPQSRARMALYSLNGQSFALNRDADGKTYNSSRAIETVNDGEGNSHFTGGQVNDTTPPVLCLDKGLTHVTTGEEIGFSYTAIDVLTQSPSMQEKGYFMLTGDDAALNAGWDPASGEEKPFNAEDYTAENLFTEFEDSHDQYVIPHVNHYVPKESEYGSALGENLKPEAAIKIYIRLTDTSSTGSQSTYIFLDWYVKDEYLLTIDNNTYIAVAKDEKGATYNLDADAVAQYQALVDEAAKDLRAGADDFYLPSFESLVSDNCAAYSDMTYSVYYLKNGTKSNISNKAASALSIDLDAAGEYKFTVYANDGASNSMWYFDNEKGKEEEFSADDIWTMYDEDEEEGTSRLPWFTFSAGVADIKVEDPGEQDMAYVGTTYTVEAFDVEGISTTETYTLYLFDNELYFNDKQEVLDYDKFIAEKQSLFENNRNYFKIIPAASELEEDSEDYLAYSAYAWNSSSRTFIPQDENAFYLVVCTVTSKQFVEMPAVKAYMGIAASATPDPITGENEWVSNNLTSIILLSIAGAALLGIILLLTIKPKEKQDIDVEFEKETAKKKAPSKKSGGKKS